MDLTLRTAPPGWTARPLAPHSVGVPHYSDQADQQCESGHSYRREDPRPVGRPTDGDIAGGGGEDRGHDAQDHPAANLERGDEQPGRQALLVGACAGHGGDVHRRVDHGVPVPMATCEIPNMTMPLRLSSWSDQTSPRPNSRSPAEPI